MIFTDFVHIRSFIPAFLFPCAEDKSAENLRHDLKQLSFDGGISKRKAETKDKPPVTHSVNM
jgi:hypothetical protein